MMAASLEITGEEKGNVYGMIKDDRIYQVLLKYNFDLFRGDKNITEYMREHCNQYYCDILDVVQGENSFLEEGFVNLLKGKLEELQDICSIIPEILELNDSGLIKATYEKGFQLFEIVMKKLIETKWLIIYYKKEDTVERGIDSSRPTWFIICVILELLIRWFSYAAFAYIMLNLSNDVFPGS